MSDDDFGGPAGSSASLPRTHVQKLIKDALPAELRTAAELVDMVVECATEFVEMVSSSANEISCKDNKTTITPEHVLQSLDQLGFLELMEGVNACWQEWKEANKSKGPKLGSRKTGAEKAGLSEEEQIALQQRMFAEARAQAAGGAAG